MAKAPVHQAASAAAVNRAEPAWRGGFYPAGLPDERLLPYYNTRFAAVYYAGGDPAGRAPNELGAAAGRDPERLCVGARAGRSRRRPNPLRDACCRLLRTGSRAIAGRRTRRSACARGCTASTGRRARARPGSGFGRGGKLALPEQANLLRQPMGYRESAQNDGIMRAGRCPWVK